MGYINIHREVRNALDGGIVKEIVVTGLAINRLVKKIKTFEFYNIECQVIFGFSGWS